MTRFRLAVAVVMTMWIAFAGAAATKAADQTASELAQALQRRIDAIKDFSTDFVHSYQGGVLKKQITERGHLLVKKPGKMRWDYTAPEPKQFVSDGLKLYSYVPQDKQVIVSPVGRDDDATTPALFLAGKGSLVRDFTPSLVDLPMGLSPGSRALKLVPKARERDYDWLVLAVDPSTLAIRGLVTSDAQGGTSTFSFLNLKENVGVADSEFVFRIPRGVDVITDVPRS
jgi:outer membrane lipoprotein carrier protein